MKEITLIIPAKKEPKALPIVLDELKKNYPTINILISMQKNVKMDIAGVLMVLIFASENGSLQIHVVPFEFWQMFSLRSARQGQCQ